jgi:hypothetical protein
LLATLPVGGLLPRQLRNRARALGIDPDAYDAALRVLRSGDRPQMVLRWHRFYRAGTEPRECLLGPVGPATIPAIPKATKRQMARDLRDAQRAEREWLYSTVVGYWRQGYPRDLIAEKLDVTFDEAGPLIKSARSWWARIGRP